jgi:radical SAM protein with 4Fe4S-binding SPASM domain
MRCPFCIHGYDKIPNVNLPTELFEKIAREAVSLGARSLKLNYINEPLLRKDLESCISLAKSVGFLNVYVVTNGTLLNEKRCESLLCSGLTKLFVSIDAATSHTYDKQRTSGKFNTVVSNVMRFIEMRNRRGLEFPLVRVSFLKNAENIHEEEMFREQWENVADIVTFQTMNEVPGQTTGLTLGAEREVTHGCSFPFKQLVVDHLGNIQPCCKLAGKELVVGNIRNMTLEQAWNSNELMELRRCHKSGEWRSHPVCGPCMNPRSQTPDANS